MRGSRTLLCHYLALALAVALFLAVVVDTFQSLVPTIPNVVGASFLHHVYHNTHNETLENFENIQDLYHSDLDFGALAEADFSLWE
jgi:hypothetical protein